MALVRAKDTKPELRVRKLLHAMGYRYRLHVRSLPGRPDLVFPGKRKAIFVHGCFWHRHRCAMGDRLPKSRIGFWRDKLESNRVRDRAVLRELTTLGWTVFIIWECESSPGRLPSMVRKLQRFLDSAAATARRGDRTRAILPQQAPGAGRDAPARGNSRGRRRAAHAAGRNFRQNASRS